MKGEVLKGYGFILPWLLGFILLTAGPMAYSLYLSFTASNLLSPPQWVGLENFQRMLFEDPLFYRSLLNTAIYAGLSVPLGLILSIGLALLLNAPVRGIGFFRTLFFFPSVTNMVAVAVLWMWIFNPEFGLLNAGLRMIGIEGPFWLQSDVWAKPALVLMSLWTVGGQMIIFLAALQGVPSDMLEAAALDGAGRRRRFFAVTLPLISPAILFNLIMGMIGAFQVFTQVFVMTGGVQPGSEGGPNNATLFIVLYIYKKAFQEFDMGYASAMSWALFVIILAMTSLAWRLSRHRVHYSSRT
ncbi:MAG: ABC transporter permease [Verrucomicrobia bacterium]|nr:MAG: ABC transporter permease [Verrucomicrobiota bacterium]